MKRKNKKALNRSIIVVLSLLAIILIGCGSYAPVIGEDVILENTDASTEFEEISTASTEIKEISTELIESTEIDNTEETDIDEGEDTEDSNLVETPNSNDTSNSKNTSDNTSTPKNDSTTKPTTTPESHKHKYAETVTKNATCSAEGQKQLKCSCGDIKTETIPATGNHNWVAQTKIVHHDALGHVEQKQVQVGTTETRHEYACSYCGFRSDTAAGVVDHCFNTGDINHAFANTIIYDYPGEPIYETQSQWVIDTPEYDETVVTGYTCSVCGTTK